MKTALAQQDSSLIGLPFPLWFRKWCQRQGLKPYQAAERLGYGVSACYAWAAGGSLPMSKVPLLAPRFGVTEETLRRVVRADVKARALLSSTAP